MKNNALQVELSFSEKASILWPYIKDNFLGQLKSIWFIVAYLAVFQILVLGLPIVYTMMICVGIFIVIVGLMFFMEGLRLGLMPLGETLGAMLPRNAPLWGVLLFAFVLGMGATFAEPAIAVLRSAGAGVQPEQAPLLYSLLNEFTTQLVTVVGIGVGLAVLLGVLRFYRNWSLKFFIIPSVIILTTLTLIANAIPEMQAILGLAWDCGAVTTGPVTVPLVLALGIGVCRILGDGDTSNAGFGIVTLASLFPILAVLSLGFFHYLNQDYVGAEHYKGLYTIERSVTDTKEQASQEMALNTTLYFTEEEYQHYLTTDPAHNDYTVTYRGGKTELINGEIVITEAQIVLTKKPSSIPALMSQDTWNPDANMLSDFGTSLADSVRAIVPLCLFLLGSLWLILKLNAERFRIESEIYTGITFAVVGMTLFMLGLSLGLTPLGSQLGGNIPTAFASLTPWGAEGGMVPAKYDSEVVGKIVAIIFGFFLGYGATLAEPALNALGNTVEKVTVGAFKKPLLMHSVAFGVGLGIAAGVSKIAFNLPLVTLLIPPYLLLIVLTWISSEEFVNFGWDSAGVTTGPITVPLVLAMGLGVGASVPGVIDGFGILALASVGPIITVLSVGLIVAKMNKEQ